MSYIVENSRGDKLIHNGNVDKQYGCGCDIEYNQGSEFLMQEPYMELLPHAYLVERFKEEFVVELGNPNDKLQVQIFYQKDISFAPQDIYESEIDWSEAAHNMKKQTSMVCADLIFHDYNLMLSQSPDIFVSKGPNRIGDNINPNELPLKVMGRQMHEPTLPEAQNTLWNAKDDIGGFGQLYTGYDPKWRWFYVRIRNTKDKPMFDLWDHTHGWTWADKAFGRKMDPTNPTNMPMHNIILNPAFDHNYPGWEGNGSDDDDDGLIG
jgi:hypothetical protein